MTTILKIRTAEKVTGSNKTILGN
uniref:Uncharacterized protein n=1 Tax=Arundo donax TaxID=35708 RepID=A0A0A8YH86_ARUDO